jgi:hypothetical protein
MLFLKLQHQRLSLVTVCCCSLDISPLQQLARQNYGAEVIKYAGGSPLSGEDAQIALCAALHSKYSLGMCYA